MVSHTLHSPAVVAVAEQGEKEETGILHILDGREVAVAVANYTFRNSLVRCNPAVEGLEALKKGEEIHCHMFVASAAEMTAGAQEER